MFGSPVPTQIGVVRGIDSQRADGQVVLPVEDRLPVRAAVGRLPNAAGRPARIQGLAVHGKRGHPAGHEPRPAAGVGPDRVAVTQRVGVIRLVGDLLPAAARRASLPAAAVAAANAAGLTVVPGAVRTAEYCCAESMISSLSPPPSLVPLCSPRVAGSSPAGPGWPCADAATGTEPIIAIKAITEPAAAACRPALLVRRIRSPPLSRPRGCPAGRLEAKSNQVLRDRQTKRPRIRRSLDGESKHRRTLCRSITNVIVVLQQLR